MQSCSCSQHEGFWLNGGRAPYHSSPRCQLERSGQLDAPASLPTRVVLLVLIGWESEWASETVWMLSKAKQHLSLPDIEPRDPEPPAPTLVTTPIPYPSSMDRYGQDNWHILIFFLSFLRKRQKCKAISILSWHVNILHSLCLHSVSRTVPCSYASRSLSLSSISQSSVLRSSSLLLRLQHFFEQALTSPYSSASIIRPQNVENGVRFRSDCNFRFSARDQGTLHLCLGAQWRPLSCIIGWKCAVAL